jgi:hypothetical protein
MTLQGTCLGIREPPNATAPIWATCNMSHASAPYEAYCDPAEQDGCAYPQDMAPNDPRLGQLCSLICAGCG